MKNRMKKFSKFVAFRIDPILLEAIENFSKIHNIKFSESIRRILKKGLKDEIK